MPAITAVNMIRNLSGLTRLANRASAEIAVFPKCPLQVPLYCWLYNSRKMILYQYLIDFFSEVDRELQPVARVLAAWERGLNR